LTTPFVLLTSKHEGEISEPSIPYLSKTPITKEIIKLTLLRDGQLSLDRNATSSVYRRNP